MEKKVFYIPREELGRADDTAWEQWRHISNMKCKGLVKANGSVRGRSFKQVLG